MPVWEIILIVLGVIAAIIFVVFIISLICYCLVFYRGLEIDYKVPLEFRLSGYRRDKERMHRDFDWFDKQPFQDLELDYGKMRLHSLYLKTEGATKVAIFFHGYRDSARNEFSAMIPFFQKLGYNICLVSQRSHGNSSGKLITFGIREQKDCLKWIEFIDKKYNPDEILLMGVSMGASTVLMASNRVPDKVKYVIADCGYSCPDEQVRYIINYLHFPMYPTIWFVKSWLYIFTGIKFSKFKIPRMLRTSTVPTLFVHGKKDKMVPYYNTLLNYDEKPVNKELLFIDNAPHAGAYIYGTEKYQKAIVNFIEKYKDADRNLPARKDDDD